MNGHSDQQSKDSGLFAGIMAIAFIALCFGLFFAQIYNEMIP